MSYHKYLRKGRKYLKNNPMVPWIIAGLVVLFLLNPGAMSSIKASESTFTAAPGETVSIQMVLVNDVPDWVGTVATVIQDEQNFGGSDKKVWYGTVSTTASVIIDYTVPTTPGTYVVKYKLSFSGSDTSYTRVTFNVVDNTPDPVPDPTPTPTPTPDPVDPVDPVVVLGEMSIFDQVLLIFDLLYQWIDSMLGGISA